MAVEEGFGDVASDDLFLKGIFWQGKTLSEKSCSFCSRVSLVMREMYLRACEKNSAFFAFE